MPEAPSSWWRCHVEGCRIAGVRNRLDPPRIDGDAAAKAGRRHYMTEHYRPAERKRT